MPTSMYPKKTVLKGDPIRKEGVAGAAVTPGQLVDFDDEGKKIPHSNTGGTAAKAFAAEQDFLGSNIDTPYSVGDQVQYNVFRPGDEVYAFLANGQNVKKGQYLESAGNGALKALDTGFAVGRAIESVDNSAGAEPVRIKVEVL